MKHEAKESKLKEKKEHVASKMNDGDKSYWKRQAKVRGYKSIKQYQKSL